MKTRIYVVGVLMGDVLQQFLVDAASQASAKRHVADRYIKAEVANGKDVGRLMQRGVKLEQANEEPAAAATQPLPGLAPGVSLDLKDDPDAGGTGKTGSDDEPLPADKSFEELEAEGAHRT